MRTIFTLRTRLEGVQDREIVRRQFLRYRGKLRAEVEEAIRRLIAA